MRWKPAGETPYLHDLRKQTDKETFTIGLTRSYWAHNIRKATVSASYMIQSFVVLITKSPFSFGLPTSFMEKESKKLRDIQMSTKYTKIRNKAPFWVKDNKFP